MECGSSDGNRVSSNGRTSEEVTATDHMYVKKGSEGNYDISTQHLTTKNRKHTGTYMIEKNVEKREYSYGSKSTRKGGISSSKKAEAGKLAVDLIMGVLSGKKKK